MISDEDRAVQTTRPNQKRKLSAVQRPPCGRAATGTVDGLAASQEDEAELFIDNRTCAHLPAITSNNQQ